MREDVRRDVIKTAIARARQAREEGDDEARRAALTEAWEHAQALADPPLLATACWRLAKARHDAGLHTTAIDALSPLFELTVEERNVWGVRHAVGPFDHYPAGLRALQVLTRHHWDHAGYGSDTLDRLWRAYVDHHTAEGHPFLAAWGQVQRAWQLAAAGRLDALVPLVEQHARLMPRDFREAVHRHPRAEDGPASVAWIQLDLARTLVRAATWSGDARAAADGHDLLEDAIADTGLDRATDPWVLDARVRAAPLVRDHRLLDEDVAALRRHVGADTLDPFHRDRVRAWLAWHDGDVEAAHEAACAALARPGAPGPEWRVSCAHLAAHTAADAARRASFAQAASEEARRTGVRQAAPPSPHTLPTAGG